MDKNIAIGTDIGGSHIRCAAINLNNGNILNQTLIERAVNNKAQASTIISLWTGALSEVLNKVSLDKVNGIGIAMPGPFDYVKGISYITGVAKYENLYGFNIADAISSSLEVPEGFPIRFMNDASAFAVGESWSGRAKNTTRSVSVTFGTGFGSAFIIDNIPIVEGPEVPGIGCLYHIPYLDGIADDYFSSRGLLNRYKTLSGNDLGGVKELAEIAQKDNKVLDIFIEFGEDVASFLSPWLKKFGPEILVLGGKISYAYDLFGEAFESRLKKENCNIEVALSELKEDAAILGSALLLNDDFWKSVQKALPLM